MALFEILLLPGAFFLERFFIADAISSGVLELIEVTALLVVNVKGAVRRICVHGD